MRSLNEIARDMRDMSQLLLEGAAELEKVAASIQPLAALLGLPEGHRVKDAVRDATEAAAKGAGKGETVKHGPFPLGPPRPVDPELQRLLLKARPETRKLTPEEKAFLRELWEAMPEAERTLEKMREFAAEYHVRVTAITGVLRNNCWTVKEDDATAETGSRRESS